MHLLVEWLDKTHAVEVAVGPKCLVAGCFDVISEDGKTGIYKTTDCPAKALDLHCISPNGFHRDLILSISLLY